MNQLGQNVQQQTLVNNLMRLGLNAEQILQLYTNPSAVNVPPIHSNPVGSYTPPQVASVKHESESIALKPQDAAYEEGLLLKMFSTFCGEQPQSAKELSIAFTKFARWIQSTVDKAG